MQLHACPYAPSFGESFAANGSKSNIRATPKPPYRGTYFCVILDSARIRLRGELRNLRALIAASGSVLEGERHECRIATK
jgi:hypothetical protein